MGLKGLERDLIAELLAERAGEGLPDDDGFGSSQVVEPGAAARTAESRAASSSPASLILRRGRSRALAAVSAISAGLPAEIVKAVVTGAGGMTPAST